MSGIVFGDSGERTSTHSQLVKAMSRLDAVESQSTNVALSVIIVSYKCLPLLRQCLDSVSQECGSTELELIVVDNASLDGTTDEVRRSYPAVKLIANEQNMGFPVANNQALRIACARNILLLNPDTVVSEGAISTLLRFLERPPHAKVVGLEVRNIDGTLQNSVQWSLPGGFQFICEQIGLTAAAGKKEHEFRQLATHSADPQRVGSVSGAALAFSREVIEAIGGFDEKMFWAEDLDFCFRAHAAGIPIYFLPRARILHYGGESGKRNFRGMIFAQHHSRVEFASRHYGRTAALALRVAFLLMLPAKMVLRLLQLPLAGRRNESSQRLAGYWDAFVYCLIGAVKKEANIPGYIRSSRVRPL